MNENNISLAEDPTINKLVKFCSKQVRNDIFVARNVTNNFPNINCYEAIPWDITPPQVCVEDIFFMKMKSKP